MYLKTRLQIRPADGAEDAHDKLENMSLFERVQVVIDGRTYDAEVLDYELREEDPGPLVTNQKSDSYLDQFPHDEHVGLDLPEGYGS